MRTIHAATRGYWRRRAWPVWHDVVLARWTNDALKQLSLHHLNGEPPPPVDEEAEAERRLAALRDWKAVLPKTMIN